MRKEHNVNVFSKCVFVIHTKHESRNHYCTVLEVEMFLQMLVEAIMLLIMFHLELTQNVVLLILGAMLSLAHDSSHH